MRLAAAAALLLVLSSPARAIKKERWFSAASGSSQARFIDVVSETLVVKFSSGTTTPASRKRAIESLGAGVGKDFESLGGWVTVKLSTGTSIRAAMASFAAMPGVEKVEPDGVIPVSRVPNDPLYAGQWGLAQINAAEAWEYGVGGTVLGTDLVTVAVLDTGIDNTNAEVSGKLTGTSQYFNPAGGQAANNPPTAACAHGTQVASVAAADTNNGVQMAGVSWNAKLISLKIVDPADCGGVASANCPDTCEASNTSIANAIDHARTLHQGGTIGKVVVNISFGGQQSCSGLVQTAVTNAVNAGVVIVAASGNDARSTVSSPANCVGVIPVGAVDSSGSLASFSNTGPELNAYGLVAPGVNVRVATPGGTTTEISGTSFSSPHVAGAAALILSAKPSFGPAEVRQTLRNSANNIGASGIGTSSTRFGAGRLNAFLAMQLAVKGRIADTEGEEKVVAFPNPLRIGQASQTFFAIPASLHGDEASIKIYTVDGSFVRELASLAWDGKNSAGKLVASGTYVFVYKTNSTTKTGRVAVIR